MAHPNQRLQFILYVLGGNPACDSIIAMIPPRVRIAVQDVELIPKERRPTWLTGVPMLVRVKDRQMWHGNKAREQVAEYVSWLNTHVVLDPPREEQLPIVNDFGEMVDGRVTTHAHIPRSVQSHGSNHSSNSTHSFNASTSSHTQPRQTFPESLPPPMPTPGAAPLSEAPLNVSNAPGQFPTPMSQTPQPSQPTQQPVTQQPPTKPKTNPNVIQPLPPPDVDINGQMMSTPQSNASFEQST